MKKLIVYFISLFILISLPIQSRADNTIFGIGNDKFAHAFAGFTGQVICEAISNHAFKNASSFSKSLGCFLFITAIGVTKELMDPANGGKQEAWDVGAGMIGSGLAIPVLIYGFN